MIRYITPLYDYNPHAVWHCSPSRRHFSAHVPVLYSECEASCSRDETKLYVKYEVFETLSIGSLNDLVMWQSCSMALSSTPSITVCFLKENDEFYFLD